jgi:uncharacterized membrane protein YhdT
MAMAPPLHGWCLRAYENGQNRQGQVFRQVCVMASAALPLFLTVVGYRTENFRWTHGGKRGICREGPGAWE